MWGFLVGVLALSGLLAVLQLATSLYMLAVYDQVVPERSGAALAALTGLVVALHVVAAVLDVMRARIVCQAGLSVAERLDGRVLVAPAAAADARGFAMLDDVERVRRFLTSGGPCAAFDVLWLPVFIGAVFLLHPVLGLFALTGAGLLAGLAVLGEASERRTGYRIAEARRDRYVLLGDLRMARWRSGDDVRLHWQRLSRSYSEATLAAQARLLSVAAVGKGVRLTLQSGGFGLGALLAIEGMLSPGGLVASSLMLMRVFACLDGALTHWSGAMAAGESYGRLVEAAGPGRGS
ncbi:hypothetical protein [Hyphomicrobium sp.]|uniref:hypothetical protein n=1 Tax=Hyphomicrobium sp. TaxID=82 RepID=UPI0025BFB3BA|nr:hypothetical protein [Hyphomicrobium sp.]MCC7250519.1 hypothetical protein [Hyphomicrobium sp.]